MSKESIVSRIVGDAEREASEIIAEAERKAGETVAAANARAERNLQGTRAETEQRAKAIADGKAATARLDCAKIELGEKRRVIDEVYLSALNKLVALDRKQSVALAESLLEKYAEEGDEVVFAVSYKYARDIAECEVFKRKKLKLGKQDAAVNGGFVLLGKVSDKDLSYASLLAADRELHQSEIASEIFITG